MKRIISILKELESETNHKFSIEVFSDGGLILRRVDKSFEFDKVNDFENIDQLISYVKETIKNRDEFWFE